MSFALPSWAGPPNRDLTLEVRKDGEIAGIITLGFQQQYELGRVDTNDIKLDHPSISRAHAYFVHGSATRLAPGEVPLSIVDWGSTHGTFIADDKDPSSNGSSVPIEQYSRLAPRTFITLKQNSLLRFGGSSRIYILRQAAHIDVSQPAEQAKVADSRKRPLDQLAPSPSGTSRSAGGFKSGGVIYDTEEHLQLAPRESIETHWEKQASSLGDANKSEKFLKLLGARKKPKG